MRHKNPEQWTAFKQSKRENKRANGGWGGGGCAGHLVVCVESEHQVSVVEQLAGVGDVDGCLRFVPGQHPDLYTSLTKGLNGFRNILLETILNSCGSCKINSFYWYELLKKTPRSLSLSLTVFISLALSLLSLKHTHSYT